MYVKSFVSFFGAKIVLGLFLPVLIVRLSEFSQVSLGLFSFRGAKEYCNFPWRFDQAQKVSVVARNTFQLSARSHAARESATP